MTEAIFGAMTIMIMIVAAWALLSIFPRVYRAVVGDDDFGRMNSLDGLRGLLALGVVVHHGIIARAYYASGVWDAPESHFNNQIGAAAVAMFFMVSAYLFWGRVLRARAPIDWVHFFRGRVYRLAPMYLVAVAFLLAIVAVESQFALRVSPRELATEIGHWMSFAFLSQPDINGVTDTFTILSVLWSLKFEWVLYGALPLLAFAWRKTGSAMLIYAVIVAISLLGRGYSFLVFFPAGMLAIHLKAWRPDSKRIDAAWALGGLASLVTLCVFYRYAVGIPQAALIMVAFVAALRPWGPWTLLRAPVMRFLGHISYSVYLLHNLAIHVLAKWGFGPTAYAALDDIQLYGSIALLGVGVIALSTATYLLVETPFIALAAKPVTPRWLPWGRSGQQAASGRA